MYLKNFTKTGLSKFFVNRKHRFDEILEFGYEFAQSKENGLILRQKIILRYSCTKAIPAKK